MYKVCRRNFKPYNFELRILQPYLLPTFYKIFSTHRSSIMNECLKGHTYGFHDSPIQPSKYDVKPQTINQSCDSVQARDTVT